MCPDSRPRVLHLMLYCCRPLPKPASISSLGAGINSPTVEEFFSSKSKVLFRYLTHTARHGLLFAHTSGSHNHAICSLLYIYGYFESLSWSFVCKVHKPMANVRLVAWACAPCQQKPARQIRPRCSNGAEHDQPKRCGAYKNHLRQRRAL